MYLDKNEEVVKGVEYEDLVAKDILLPMFRNKFGERVTIYKGGEFDNFDRQVLLNNSLLGNIEIKRRYFNKDEYETIIIPYRKYKEYLENDTMDYWLVIGWNDVIGMIKMNSTKPVGIYNLERGDRNDGVKPHVEYRVSDFTIIKKFYNK